MTVIKQKAPPKRKRRRKRRYKQGTYVSTKTGNSCKYRSGWELKYFEYLDSDSDVIEWESEPFAIPYVSNKTSGKIRKYIPDILVKRTSSGVTLEEIKPSNKLTKRLVARKLQAGRDWATENNSVFVVITEVELKILGLL